MKLFILLIGMVLIVEGLPYATAPEFMKGWLKKLSELDPSQLRKAGLAALVCGLVICGVVQRGSFFQ